MNSKVLKNRFFLALGFASLATAIITVIRFILLGSMVEIWSLRGILSLVFAIAFFWAGVELLRLGQRTEWANRATVIAGIACLVASFIVFVVFGFRQIKGDLAVLQDFLSFAALLGFSFFLGNMATRVISENPAGYLHYNNVLNIMFGLYGLATLILAIALVIKYVFTGSPFAWGIFVGEIALLIIGAIIFVTKFVTTEE